MDLGVRRSSGFLFQKETYRPLRQETERVPSFFH
jgi:hypothetical protein